VNRELAGGRSVVSVHDRQSANRPQTLHPSIIQGVVGLGLQGIDGFKILLREAQLEQGLLYTFGGEGGPTRAAEAQRGYHAKHAKLGLAPWPRPRPTVALMDDVADPAD
jgi:hypothetical protein